MNDYITSDSYIMTYYLDDKEKFGCFRVLEKVRNTFSSTS
jgi:hypothetical protein